MSRKAIDDILRQVRALPSEERAALADEIDRITWRDRVEHLVNRVQASTNGGNVPSADEIDALVADVRSEKPLYERYWTRRRQSAP